jgi:dolichol-phosphate mannosyltransferase
VSAVLVWRTVGIAGTVLFGARWLVQLRASRRAGRPVTSRGFWLMSLTGALLLLVYFLLGPSHDLVGVLANLFPIGIAGYNLALVMRATNPLPLPGYARPAPPAQLSLVVSGQEEPAPPHLSVVAPAFDEEECIDAFVEETCGVLDGLGLIYELICVDDASSDGTPERLAALRARFPRLRPVRLERHGGQSAALAAGVRLTRGRIIVLMDADLQNDPADIAGLLAQVEGPASPDCAAGVRAVRRDRWLRRTSSRVANWIGWVVTGDPFRDAACGLKVCRADVLKRVPFFRGAHRFVPHLVRAMGGLVVEVPVNHRPRPRGRSKYGHGLGRALVAWRDAFGVRWLKDRALSSESHDL